MRLLAPLRVRSFALLWAGQTAPASLTRQAVQDMGFDIEEGHLDAFVRHYLHYPSFAQLAR